MAVRVSESGETLGRCLCNRHNNSFVRSYNKDKSGGYSHSDMGLEDWLKDQGYTKHHGWDGLKLRYIPHPHRNRGSTSPFIAPYIDGGAQGVYADTDDDGQQVLRITDEDNEHAEYVCNNTNGDADEVEQGESCPCCGDYTREDDRTWVGYHGDDWVCEGCIERSYMHVCGRRGQEYYVHEDNAIEVDGTYYDVDHLDDNDIVEDVDGEYHHRDNCVYLDNEDEYYPEGDRRIVCLEDGTYWLRDNAVFTIDNEWHRDDECVEVEGQWYLETDERITTDEVGNYILATDEETQGE
jgi:hypothetical protein